MKKFIRSLSINEKMRLASVAGMTKQAFGDWLNTDKQCSVSEHVKIADACFSLGYKPKVK